MTEPIPDATLRLLARTLRAQAEAYGFGFEDYVRFASVLLDEAMAGRPPAVRPGASALPLAADRVRVRAPEDGDRALLRTWCDGPAGRYFLLSRSTGRLHDVDQLFDDARAEIGVVTLSDGTPIGAVGFLQIDHGQGRAELRKLVGEPAHRGQGLGTEAAGLWVGYGLEHLGLRKLFLYTLASNQQNVHINERLGFRVEGVLRGEVLIDGEPRDLLRMGLVKP